MVFTLEGNIQWESTSWIYAPQEFTAGLSKFYPVIIASARKIHQAVVLPIIGGTFDLRRLNQNMMNANDVLIDLLEDNWRRLCRALIEMSDECLAWRPEAGTNNIIVTMWHMARILDVFLIVQARGCVTEEECWFCCGWAERTSYDPRGIGLNGWGMLTGYTQEEVLAMPPLTREQALGYLNDVYDTAKDYLANVPIEMLETPGVGFEGKYTQYQCIQMALLDNTRHLGEILAIQSSWKRRRRQNGKAA